MSARKLDSEITILGGGLVSIYASYKLIDRSPSVVFGEQNLGGILTGQKWKNFYIDNGCHFFDGNDEQFNFFETVGGTQRHNIIYGSFNQGVLSEDIATPEIQDKEMIRKIIKELQSLDYNQQYKSLDYQNIGEVFIKKFGKTCGEHLSNIQAKFTGRNYKSVIADEFDKFSVFHRVRLGDDVTSNKLKQSNAYLDNIICSSLESRGLNKYQVSMYPKKNGTTGFTFSAKKFLDKNKISLINNFIISKIKKMGDHFEIISTDGDRFHTQKIISTLPYALLSKLLGHQTNGIPEFINYKIIVLEIDKKQVLENYYVQDFDPHHSTYRSSNFGTYSNQFSEHDTTIVMAEIPFSFNEVSIDLNKIRQELIRHKILAENVKILDHHVIDKKNVIPINYVHEEIVLPKNIFSVEKNSFSMKSKFADVEKIIKKI